MKNLLPLLLWQARYRFRQSLSMKTTHNLRTIAANVIGHVLDKGQSLSSLLPQYQRDISEKDRALLQELCFSVLRMLPQLEWIIQQLMEKTNS